jgi:hypothetical protein
MIPHIISKIDTNRGNIPIPILLKSPIFNSRLKKRKKIPKITKNNPGIVDLFLIVKVITYFSSSNMLEYAGSVEAVL